MDAQSPLLNISPVDGRYAATTRQLSHYFSEYALIKTRVEVEIQYLIFLSEQGFFTLSGEAKNGLLDLIDYFTVDRADLIKALEQTTNHDVKAVEYFLRGQLGRMDKNVSPEWVHFGLTSQDVNNTANPLLLKRYLENVYQPAMQSLVRVLWQMSNDWMEIPMLARTHGQPASPTTLGKEIAVFAYRLDNQLNQLSALSHTAKFGGATGNFNAHKAAFPDHDWPLLGAQFLKEKLGLERQEWTTQIDNYDGLAAQLDAAKRINTILIDFARDIWSYVSMDYFTQKTKPGEVGSSAMPHKVNPIDFENAEGNLGLANALLEHLSAKLPVSRLQRDLTDSTVLRNLGVPFAHFQIALNSLLKGIGKLVLNEIKLKSDLEANWAVTAEAIQTILRRENYPDPYNALKALTRGQEGITEQSIGGFIDNLDVSEDVKQELRRIRPENYTGFAGKRSA